jgi:hypothetical protein
MRGRLALLGILSVAVLGAAAEPAFAEGTALKQEHLASAGVAFEVPSSWVGSAPAVDQQARHVVEVYASPERIDLFHANLSVRVAAVPGSMTVRRWLFGDSDTTYREYLRAGVLQTISIHGAPGLEYTSAEVEAASLEGPALLVVEYAFINRGRAYLFTYLSVAKFGRSAPLRTRGEALAQASAGTIRFVSSRPSP